MYTRQLPLPTRSFFLFGPRGTGKTTWLRANLEVALRIDLLRNEEYLRYLRDAGAFRRAAEGLRSSGWIVIDEIQKIPALLDEVHSLLEDHPGRFRFALTGSSARKLKREGANLLAGRAVNRNLFPLISHEVDYKLDLDTVLRFGCLPAQWDDSDERSRIDYLEAYAVNYLREEVHQEALVRNLDSFSRFLSVAAVMNGQVMNVAGIARDAAVSRPTVQGYVDVLTDTLLAMKLPAWRARAKVKEAQHPKFFLFDTGVCRALSGRLREPLEAAERGHLLETWLLNELRAAVSYQGIGGELCYWGTPSGGEADFVWVQGRRSVGIEVKAGSTWRREYSKTLNDLMEQGTLKQAYGVYTGDRELLDGKVRVLPVLEFLKSLHSGGVLV